MSTKIYNGHITSRPMDALELQDHIALLKDESFEIAKDEISKVFTKDAVEYYDKWCLSKIELEKSPFFTVLKGMMERQREVKKSGLRDPEIDMEFKVYVYQIPDGHWLLLPITEQDSVIKNFSNKSWVKPYPYWNNTDKPDECTESEWEFRKEVWDLVTRSYNIEEKMWCVTLIPLEYFFRDISLDEHIPDFETRVNNVMEYEVFDLYMDHIGMTHQELTDKKDFSAIMEIRRESLKWKKEEGKDIFEQRKKDIESKLESNLTSEHLKAEPSPSNEESNKEESNV